MNKMNKQAPIVFALLVPLLLTAATGARAGHEKPALPAYTRLSDATILRMGLPEFSFRYGSDDSGRGADDRLHYFAGCLARRSDRRAKGASPTAFARLAALRKRLSAWDERRFTPAQRYTGGMLEQGHQEATFHVEREQFLETLIPLLAKKRTGPPSQNERAARTAFRAWVKQSEKDSIPLPEQLAGGDAVEKNAVRLQYAAWYALLKDEARRVEAAALPSPAAARVLRYAVAQ